jgi:hypothetical protein
MQNRANAMRRTFLPEPHLRTQSDVWLKNFMEFYTINIVKIHSWCLWSKQTPGQNQSKCGDEIVFISI